eukprot:363504-Chlamydomonas_euryale.AAC.8
MLAACLLCRKAPDLVDAHPQVHDQLALHAKHGRKRVRCVAVAARRVGPAAPRHVHVAQQPQSVRPARRRAWRVLRKAPRLQRQQVLVQLDRAAQVRVDRRRCAALLVMVAVAVAAPAAAAVPIATAAASEPPSSGRRPRHKRCALLLEHARVERRRAARVRLVRRQHLTQRAQLRVGVAQRAVR